MSKYVSKKDCLKNGFVKNKNGIYKMTLLERYYLRGWLDFGCEKYSAKDRFDAAEKLQQDYEASHFMAMSASVIKPKVDCSVGAGIDEVEVICKAREQYFAAVSQIPEEFFTVIQKICLEGKDPDIDESLPERRKLEVSFSLKMDLCRGLDRLVRYYSFK